MHPYHFVEGIFTDALPLWLRATCHYTCANLWRDYFMSGQPWKRMWEIFHQALEKPPGERDAFLREACAGDDELRREVEELLDSHEQSHGPLDVTTGTKGNDDPSSDPLLGEKIGSYLVREVIGKGGMGVVYSAEQEKPVRRPVAVKVIKLGMDTREVVARFEAERQALALMRHPNICRV